MLETIRSRINEKRGYALFRCIEEMCCCEDFAVGRLGGESECESIRYKKLTQQYHTLLQTCPIELFYCGRAEEKQVAALLREALATARYRGTDYPAELTVRLNGQDLVCYLTDHDLEFRRGTFATPGYSGTVAYYSVMGHSDFGADSGLEEGEIWYFTFADRDHCATWENVRGWYGDSWGNVAGEYGFGE